MDDSDQIQRRGVLRSNLGRRLTRGWRRARLLSRSDKIEEVTGRHHGQRQESSGSHYGALNFDPILPTQSRRHKELLLLTCDDENGSHRVGSVGVVRTGFNGVEVFFRRCSNFLVLPSSFLSSQLLQTATKNSNLVAT
jgi:hypothetical protein